MTELKPCPFCGETAVTRLRFYKHDGIETTLLAEVSCKYCDTHKSELLKLCDTSFEQVNESFNRVIEMWNRRAYETD